MKIDAVNGLCYLTIRWIAHVSVLSKSDMQDLEASLKRLAAQHNDEDSIAFRCFATAVQAYLMEN
jgi:hypothetical protein